MCGQQQQVKKKNKARKKKKKGEEEGLTLRFLSNSRAPEKRGWRRKMAYAFGRCSETKPFMQPDDPSRSVFYNYEAFFFFGKGHKEGFI